MVARYGQPEGLRARLANFAQRLRTDRNFPWLGTGIIADLEVTMQILNLREFASDLRTKGTPEQARYAAEILQNEDVLDGLGEAIGTVRTDMGPDGLDADDPIGAIRAIDAVASAAQADYEAIRGILVTTGALDSDDTETPIADLLRVLLS